MKVAVFNTKSYDKHFFEESNAPFGHNLQFFKTRLTSETLLSAAGFPCVCIFVNDLLNAEDTQVLAENGTKLIALRCAGFNNVDVKAAAHNGIKVVRVPAYSPYSVAEYTVALIMTLSRKTHRAYNRVREGNFSLKGLLGSEIHGKAVGIVGTGMIGYLVARLMKGFGCDVYAYDIKENPNCIDLGIKYVSLEDLYRKCDIISLHCPLNKATYHLINEHAFNLMKAGVMLINTVRGALIDTLAATEAIKQGKLGYLGIDVYEQESELFFEDQSNQIIQDDVFQRLTTFPNVLVTGHQGFFTDTALKNIADTTLLNIHQFEHQKPLENIVE